MSIKANCYVTRYNRMCFSVNSSFIY